MESDEEQESQVDPVRHTTHEVAPPSSGQATDQRQPHNIHDGEPKRSARDRGSEDAIHGPDRLHQRDSSVERVEESQQVDIEIDTQGTDRYDDAARSEDVLGSGSQRSSSRHSSEMGPPPVPASKRQKVREIERPRMDFQSPSANRYWPAHNLKDVGVRLYHQPKPARSNSERARTPTEGSNNVHLLAEAGMPVRGQQFIRSTSAERASPNLEDASGSNRHNDGPRQIRSLKQKRRDSSASPEKVEKARKKNQGSPPFKDVASPRSTPAVGRQPLQPATAQSRRPADDATPDAHSKQSGFLPQSQQSVMKRSLTEMQRETVDYDPNRSPSITAPEQDHQVLENRNAVDTALPASSSRVTDNGSHESRHVFSGRHLYEPESTSSDHQPLKGNGRRATAGNSLGPVSASSHIVVSQVSTERTASDSGLVAHPVGREQLRRSTSSEQSLPVNHRETPDNANGPRIQRANRTAETRDSSTAPALQSIPGNAAAAPSKTANQMSAAEMLRMAMIQAANERKTQENAIQMIRMQEEQIAQLSEEKEALETELQHYGTHYERLVKKAKALQGKCEGYEDMQQTLQSQQALLEQKAEELRRKEETLMEKYALPQDLLQSILGQQEETFQKCDAVRELLTSEYQPALDQAKKEAEEARVALTEQQAARVGMEKDINRTLNELQLERGKSSKLEQQLDAITHSRQSLETGLKEEVHKAVSTLAEHGALHSQVSEAVLHNSEKIDACLVTLKSLAENEPKIKPDLDELKELCTSLSTSIGKQIAEAAASSITIREQLANALSTFNLEILSVKMDHDEKQEFQNAIRALSEENATYKERVSAREAESTRLQSLVDDLKSQLRECKDQLLDLKQSNRELKEKLSLPRDDPLLQNRVAALLTQQESLQLEISAAQEEAKKAKAELQVEQQSRQKIQEHVAELERKLEPALANIKNFNTEKQAYIEQSRAESNALRMELERNAQARLEEDTAHLQATAHGLRSQLSQSEAKIARMEEDLKRHRGSEDDTANLIDELRDEIAELEERVAGQGSELIEITEGLQAKEKDREAAANEISALRELLKRCEADINVWKAKAETTAERLTKQCQDISEESKEADAEAQVKIAELEAQLEESSENEMRWQKMGDAVTQGLRKLGLLRTGNLEEWVHQVTMDDDIAALTPKTSSHRRHSSFGLAKRLEDAERILEEKSPASAAQLKRSFAAMQIDSQNARLDEASQDLLRQLRPNRPLSRNEPNTSAKLLQSPGLASTKARLSLPFQESRGSATLGRLSSSDIRGPRETLESQHSGGVVLFDSQEVRSERVSESQETRTAEHRVTRKTVITTGSVQTHGDSISTRTRRAVDRAAVAITLPQLLSSQSHAHIRPSEALSSQSQRVVRAENDQRLPSSQLVSRRAHKSRESSPLSPALSQVDFGEFYHDDAELEGTTIAEAEVAETQGIWDPISVEAQTSKLSAKPQDNGTEESQDLDANMELRSSITEPEGERVPPFRKTKAAPSLQKEIARKGILKNKLPPKDVAVPQLEVIGAPQGQKKGTGTVLTRKLSRTSSRGKTIDHSRYSRIVTGNKSSNNKEGKAAAELQRSGASPFFPTAVGPDSSPPNMSQPQRNAKKRQNTLSDGFDPPKAKLPRVHREGFKK